MHDEAHVESGRYVGPLPRLAEQLRLVRRRERGRLANVPPRRSEGAGIVATIASETLRAGTMRRCTGRPCRSASATTSESRRRSFGVGSLGRRLAADVEANEPDGENHHVATARSLERGGDMSQGVRVAHRHQHVARAGINLVEGELRRRQQIERLAAVGRRGGRGRPDPRPKPDRQDRDERRRRDRGRIAGGNQGERTRGHGTAGEEQAQREVAASESEIERSRERPGVPGRAAQPNERRDLQGQHHRYGDPVSARQPRGAPAARQDGQNRDDHRDIDGSRRRAEADVQRGQSRGQEAVGRPPLQQAFDVAERRVEGRQQHQHRGGGQREAGSVTQPRGPGQSMAPAPRAAH